MIDLHQDLKCRQCLRELTLLEFLEFNCTDCSPVDANDLPEQDLEQAIREDWR